jgi:oleandomycin transport system ATP-binding protein
MWEVVRSLVADGSTVLLTTQYLDEADALADEISVIDRGRVIAHDTPDGLKRVVGGQRIEIRPSDAGRIPEVRAILGEITGAAPEVVGRERLSVAVADEQYFAPVVARLAADGIGVHELSLHLPSLDEVFLTLTGRTTDQTSEENAA